MHIWIKKTPIPQDRGKPSQTWVPNTSSNKYNLALPMRTTR